MSDDKDFNIAGYEEARMGGKKAALAVVLLRAIRSIDLSLKALILLNLITAFGACALIVIAVFS